MKTLLAPVRIVIVDDHPMMRDGLALRISAHANWEVCGEAATEDEGLELVKQLCPDVVIIDVALKAGNGIELVKRIKLLNSTAKLLVVSAFHESLYAERALRAGAHGYLNKQETNDHLIEAVRIVIKGERYMSLALTQRMVAQALGKRSENQDPRELLTDRELEIFRLIGSGLKTSAIADQLFLSTHTIDTHRENIKRKLGAKTGAELSRLAIQSMLESI
jgi:DNA-binding NarL/FixJ family response regulator